MVIMDDKSAVELLAELLEAVIDLPEDQGILPDDKVSFPSPEARERLEKAAISAEEREAALQLEGALTAIEALEEDEPLSPHIPPPSDLYDRISGRIDWVRLEQEAGSEINDGVVDPDAQMEEESSLRRSRRSRGASSDAGGAGNVQSRQEGARRSPGRRALALYAACLAIAIATTVGLIWGRVADEDGASVASVRVTITVTNTIIEIRETVPPIGGSQSNQVGFSEPSTGHRSDVEECAHALNAVLLYASPETSTNQTQTPGIERCLVKMETLRHEAAVACEEEFVRQRDGIVDGSESSKRGMGEVYLTYQACIAKYENVNITETSPASAMAQSAENLDDHVFYSTCAEVLKSWGAPLPEGSPGYRIGLDANWNGMACEVLPKDYSSIEGLQTPSAEDWDRIAQCESNGDWGLNNADTLFGGLQISIRNWILYGGREFAMRPDGASKEQQIEIAERMYADRGMAPWACR